MILWDMAFFLNGCYFFNTISTYMSDISLRDSDWFFPFPPQWLISLKLQIKSYTTAFYWLWYIAFDGKKGGIKKDSCLYDRQTLNKY